jgi:hypothetical protein
MKSNAVLVGAAGPLGSAVLEQCLSAFARVRVVVDAPIAPAMRGFEALPRAALDEGAPLLADTAFIVFDRERFAHGREDAFHRPQPQSLLALAQALHRGGVRRLLVVLPHKPALLPDALKRGLASLDEQAVASLGFEHLVIVRSAQRPGAQRADSWPQRVADAVLAQLHWMVPQREQPVRAAKVAAFVVQLARHLRHARAGARVVPPELLWHAAQERDPAALASRWLSDGRLPDADARNLRRRW